MKSGVRYDIVKRAVDAADPCGLLAMGAPSDEYEAEAAKIAKAINDGDTAEKIAEVACGVFSKAFLWDIPVLRNLPERFGMNLIRIINYFPGGNDYERGYDCICCTAFLRADRG